MATDVSEEPSASVLRVTRFKFMYVEALKLQKSLRCCREFTTCSAVIESVG